MQSWCSKPCNNIWTVQLQEITSYSCFMVFFYTLIQKQDLWSLLPRSKHNACIVDQNIHRLAQLKHLNVELEVKGGTIYLYFPWPEFNHIFYLFCKALHTFHGKEVQWQSLKPHLFLSINLTSGSLPGLRLHNPQRLCGQHLGCGRQQSPYILEQPEDILILWSLEQSCGHILDASQSSSS